MSKGTSELKKSLENLLNGGYIETTINENITMADIEDSEEKLPEKVYHAFTLGLLIALNKTHQVLSNRESGQVYLLQDQEDLESHQLQIC